MRLLAFLLLSMLPGCAVLGPLDPMCAPKHCWEEAMSEAAVGRNSDR